MRNECVEFSVFTERLYRTFLDLIKHELDKAGVDDINSVQAFILLNIDDNSVTMSEIISKGYYIGSNASYNLRKMVNNSYLEQKTSSYDKRISYLSLTEKGKNLLNKLQNKLDKHTKNLEKNLDNNFSFKSLSNLFSNIENNLKNIINKY